MKSKIATFGFMAAACVGSAAMVGCDETVSKEETVRTGSDGSRTTKTDVVEKEADGTMKRETETEVTPATQPAM